ncbi:MAG: hypothetical protein ABMB14_20360 [Myxococcota bacterium]
MRVRWQLGWIAAVGCTGAEIPLEPSPARIDDDPTAVGLEALASVGAVPHAVTVRSVNGYGAAVASDETDAVFVDDARTTVRFDGYGYGAVTIDVAGTAEVTAGDTVLAYTVANDWAGAAMNPAWPAPVAEGSLGLAITTGMVVAAGSELWWAGDGAAPHRVLAADGDEILGLRAGNIDVDGITDLVAWTAERVFLLRGRPGGGLGWGTSFVATGLEVGGVDIGDLSTDNLPDVAIAWHAPGAAEDGILDIWQGDGLFGFTAAEPRTIPGLPVSVAVADNTGEGVAQVTVLHAAGDWSRYIRGAESKYIPIGPRAPTGTMILPDGSSLFRTGDTNRDNAEEIAVGGPRAVGQGGYFWFVDVATDAAACQTRPDDPELQCGTEYLPLEDESGAWMAMGDGNGDFLSDIFLELDTKVLYAVALDPDQVQGEFRKIRILDLPAYGPLDLTDFDRDGELDLAIAGDPVWWRWYGQGDDDLEVFWTPRPTPVVAVREALDPPFGFAELDSDPNTIEVVGFASEAGDTALKILRYTKGGGRASLLGQLTIDPTGALPDDVAICGKDVYVVVGGAVSRLSVLDPAHPAIAASIDGTASRVDCGDGPSNTDVAVLDGGEVRLRTRAVLAPVGAPIAAGAARDVAIGELGGTPTMLTCASEGCSIVHWALPEPVFAIGRADGTTVIDATGVEQEIGGGGGALSVADVDADGVEDLIGLAPGSLVTIHRSAAGAITPPVLLHTDLGFAGTIGVRDGDGDGQADLWAIDANRDLVYTLASIPSTTTTGSTGGTTAPPTP